MSSLFDADDLERARRLHGDDLDKLPFGVIGVDRKGVILEYNRYERSMAGIGERSVVGTICVARNPVEEA
ncbi:MAG: hypothetical protein WCE44_08780 [Candidatus Velthaea sp.]